MPTSSATPVERARKIEALVLQAANKAESQKAIAIALGLSEATINRLLNDHLNPFSRLLSQLGMKVVSAESKCVSAEAYDFLTRTHTRIMERAPELIWDVEE